jgi:phosphoribosylformylglycinamidine synthase
LGPIKDGLTEFLISANWMWACKNEGEDARLYAAVESCSRILQSNWNIPTGKDSSMKQNIQMTK